MEYTISRIKRNWIIISALFLLLLPGLVPLLIKSANQFSMHQLLSLSFAIPYFFAIWFAMGFPTEQVTAVDERAGVVDGSGYLGG